jgi:hypothetical protein
MLFLITKFLCCYCLGGGTVAAIPYRTLTPEERQHTLKLDVSIGVPCRRGPGLNLLVSHVWLGIETRLMAAGPVCRFALNNFNFKFQFRQNCAAGSAPGPSHCTPLLIADACAATTSRYASRLFAARCFLGLVKAWHTNVWPNDKERVACHSTCR